MNLFGRILLGGLLGTGVMLPYMASSNGWGVKTERDPLVMKNSVQYCPSGRRDFSGRCRRSHRSYFYGRSMRGGGPGRGK